LLPSNKIKIRLPYLNLFLMTLFLSGGGFFCYTSFAQQPVTTIVVLVCIALLLGALFIQQQQRSRIQLSIDQLIRHMDSVDADSPSTELVVTEVENSQVLSLACSYNAMMMRLTETLRRSRQFAADVTHELRTPLTILRGETEIALRSNRNPEQITQVLESNLEEISRMSYLIEDLLLLSKSDLGEIPLRMEALDLSGLVMELHHQAQLLAGNKQINVDLIVPKEQIIVYADSLRLRQVLLNLLTNAIKYTHEKGSVSINLKANAENVEVAITDSGIGITDEHLKKIFERFYRIDKTLNRNDGGSGLGLAIVKWIVDSHNGQVNVRSTPGKGSCFTITLPTS
jgi:signal transduction histidine kinase